MIIYFNKYSMAAEQNRRERRIWRKYAEEGVKLASNPKSSSSGMNEHQGIRDVVTVIITTWSGGGCGTAHGGDLEVGAVLLAWGADDGGWGCRGSISLLVLLLVLVADEVNLGPGRLAGLWLRDLDVSRVLALLQEDVNEVFVLILFREDDFGLVGGGLGWGLDEDDVHVLVSSRNSDDTGIALLGLVRGAVDVDILVGATTLNSSSTVISTGSSK